MTNEELEQDIITRVFDESFLNERLLTKLLRQYRDAAVEAEREACAKIADEAPGPFPGVGLLRMCADIADKIRARVQP